MSKISNMKAPITGTLENEDHRIVDTYGGGGWDGFEGGSDDQHILVENKKDGKLYDVLYSIWQNAGSTGDEHVEVKEITEEEWAENKFKRIPISELEEGLYSNDLILCDTYGSGAWNGFEGGYEDKHILIKEETGGRYYDVLYSTWQDPSTNDSNRETKVTDLAEWIRKKYDNVSIDDLEEKLYYGGIEKDMREYVALYEKQVSPYKNITEEELSEMARLKQKLTEEISDSRCDFSELKPYVESYGKDVYDKLPKEQRQNVYRYDYAQEFIGAFKKTEPEKKNERWQSVRVQIDKAGKKVEEDKLNNPVKESVQTLGADKTM